MGGPDEVEFVRHFRFWPPCGVEGRSECVEEPPGDPRVDVEVVLVLLLDKINEVYYWYYIDDTCEETNPRP